MSPEHHLAVSGTDEGHFHMWDTRTGKLVCKTESKYMPALTSKKDMPKLGNVALRANSPLGKMGKMSASRRFWHKTSVSLTRCGAMNYTVTVNWWYIKLTSIS